MSSVVIRTFKIYSLSHFKHIELLLAIVTMLWWHLQNLASNLNSVLKKVILCIFSWRGIVFQRRNCSLSDSATPGTVMRPPRRLRAWMPQARMLGWAAIPFSRGSSQPRDRTQVSHIAGRFFTLSATRKAPQTATWLMTREWKNTSFLITGSVFIHLSSMDSNASLFMAE